MRIGIDWKRSLILTALLLIIFYALQIFIEDQETLCIASIIAFVLVFALGNLLFRGR
jgi:hypothetical protein